MTLARTSTRRSQARALLDLWPWIPVLMAIVYLAIFAVDLRSDVQGVYTDSDITSALTIGQLYGQAGHGAVVTLGNVLWFPALFFELATKGLPAHREIWEAAPYVISLIGVALVAWTVRAASSVWAGIMTAATLAVAAPFLVQQQFGWSVHALTYALVAVLGWFLVLGARHGGIIGGPIRHGLTMLLVTALVAVGLASDELFVFSGAAPFLLTALLLWWLAPDVGRPLTLSAIVVLVIGALGGDLLHHAVVRDHIVPAAFPITFAADNQLLAHAGLLIESGFDLFSGTFAGQPLRGYPALEFLCAVVVLVAIIAAVAAACRSCAGLWGRAQAPAATGPQGLDATRMAALTFWGLCAALTSLGYVVSSVALPSTERYVVSAGYGIVATLAILADRDRRRRAAVVVAVTIVTLAAVVESARHELRTSNALYPTAASAGQLAAVLRANGLRYGYAGYWTAAPLTWFMKGAAYVYPAYNCTPTTLCPFYLHTISTWYAPRPHTRSFLIDDPTQGLNPVAPASLGRPSQVLHVGHFTVDVYGYDIASRLH